MDAYSYWQLDDMQIFADDTAGVSGVRALIDSGTSQIIAPADAVAAFYSSIPGAKAYSGDSTHWLFVSSFTAPVPPSR